MARDNVGYTEDPPTVPDATTTVNLPNAVPTVVVDNATVTVPEGILAQNTGTFNDDDLDDVVEVTASVGTIVQIGSQTGTWTWTYVPADGPTDSQTVIVTATDNQGASAQAFFRADGCQRRADSGRGQ